MTSRSKQAPKKRRPQASRYYGRSLTEPPTTAAVGDFVLIPADENNVARLKSENPAELTDRKRDILRNRVTDPAEDVWLIADSDDNLCGFACLAWQDHEVKQKRHTIRVRPHQALFMDDHVFKAHRRRGAHTASVALRVPLAAQLGRDEGLVLVTTTNLGSIRSYRAAGFRPIGMLIHFPRSKRTFELRLPRWLRRR